MRRCRKCNGAIDEAQFHAAECPHCADWAPFDPMARGAHRLDAYYYGFSATGHAAIDNILAAVAAAGKSYHDTSGWVERPHGQSENPVEAIQRMADAAAANLATMTDALTMIVRNDETRFEHHQPRRWDGKVPDGGTRWLEPREIARRVLTRIGAPVPNALDELRADTSTPTKETP